MLLFSLTGWNFFAEIAFNLEDFPWLNRFYDNKILHKKLFDNSVLLENDKYNNI